MAAKENTGTNWQEKYRTALVGYEAFRSHLDLLLRELIQQSGISAQVVESRTKSEDSLAEKINRPGKDYQDPLTELPDIVGLRVILYYADDVAKVESILAKEFNIHAEHSSNKQDGLSPNEFGYLSVHHVISLKPPRTELAEWAPYVEMKAEVQIRTVLQHAWAGVSHALQYKRDSDVPNTLKRKLFRLAGLFELADEQFLEIRNEHTSLESQIAEQIEKKDPNVPLNTISLRQYLDTSPYVKHVVRFAANQGYNFDEPDYGEYDIRDDYIARLFVDCIAFKIRTLNELDAVLKSHGKAYEPYLIEIRPPSKTWHVGDAFLLYLILIQIYRNKYTLKRLVESEEWDESIAKRVLKGAAMKAVK